jgi:hypothetical protein
VEPPRGRWSNLARAHAVLSFIPAAVADKFAAWFTRTVWLKWLDRVTWTIFLVALATYLYLRGQEIVTYRRRIRTGH